MLCCLTGRVAYCQDSSTESLTQKIEILKLQLQLAESQVEKLQQECEALRKENAELVSGVKEGEMVEPEDQFSVGTVWAGMSKTVGKKDSVRWAISVSKRDGEKFEGGLAAINAQDRKLDLPVTGRAPQNGNGLVVIETPLMGRGKIFMRGTLRNGIVALAFSGTDPLGKKFVGSASLENKD